MASVLTSAMNPPATSPAPSRYGLSGRIDGVDLHFDLALGQNRVGSSSSSDIRLRIDGVSREHALLTVTPDALVVEDCGSKNGTFVNQRRIERTTVPAGAVIAFGPAELEVLEVEPEDVELALTIEPDPASMPGPDTISDFSRETLTRIDTAEQSVTATWLWLLEGFAQRLFTFPEGSLGAALAFLTESLELSGSCLLEGVGRDDPTVLASAGTLAPFGSAARIAAAVREPGNVVFSLDEAATWAVISNGEGESLGLWLWGPFPGRAGSQVLLRALLRLADGFHRRVVDSPAAPSLSRARSGGNGLRFPADYLPFVSPSMRALYRQMEALGRGDLPVLLAGETGVGKEQLAATLHRSSERRDGPFQAINCAAIPAELLEAELFGIGKGVATGVEGRRGKFRLADGGTLFLDEIGEMRPALQAKLLRALQESEVEPVGGAAQCLDVRIVAATNADLDRRPEDGGLRRDLYYRLAGCSLEIPALRDCPEDIPRLIEFFLARFVKGSGLRVRGITVKALERLTAYPWPGNVRELRHEIRRLVYLCTDSDVIDARKLSARLLKELPEPESPVIKIVDLELAPRLREYQRELISEALRRTAGQQAAAARLLGISRNGLADKIKRLAIDVAAFRP